jgi:2-amino-4-hydroxy-6-hydroxymethyldihydropteridine diphosphokinase
MLQAVIGVGANLPDGASGRLATMQRALDAIAATRGARVERVSRVYATAPVGPVAQPEFLNAAALVSWDGTPHELLDVLLAIEASLGRVRDRDARFGPRTIDLDVLYIEGMAMADERLTVPHPRLLERAFALVPLLEVFPGAALLARGAGELVVPAPERQ